MKLVESGNQTWGVKEDKSVWTLINGSIWRSLDNNTRVNYISVGTAGVWALNLYNNVLLRKGRQDFSYTNDIYVIFSSSKNAHLLHQQLD